MRDVRYFPSEQSVGGSFRSPHFALMCASCACEAIGGASVICGSREWYDTFAKISGRISVLYAMRVIRAACPVESD